MSKQLTQFDQQLMLKMTLGQQFKQAFEIPEQLQGYGITKTETAQEILQLNQYWMLLQQAAKVSKPASEKILNKLQKTAEIIAEPTLSDELSAVLAWIFNKDNPVEYVDWIHQILQIARQQQVVLPRQFILKVAQIERNPYLLAQVIPNVAFSSGVSSARLDHAKLFYNYCKDNDPQALLKSLAKTSRSDWSYLMSMICGHLPEIIQKYPVEFWQAAFEQKHTISYIDSVVTSVLPPLAQLKPIYDYLCAADNQQLDNIKNKGGLYLYAYYHNEKLYPELIEQIKKSFHFDEKGNQVVLNIDVTSKQTFEHLRVVEGVLTRQLNEVFASNLKDKAYDSFVNSEDGARYLAQILSYLPLADWNIIFSEWSQILKLKKHKKTYVNYAFILRCALEDRADLALWFYQHQQEWLERYAASAEIRSEFSNDRLYERLNSNEAISLLQQRLQLHLEALDSKKFWYVFKNSKQLFAHAWASQSAIEMILKIKAYVPLTDSEKFDELKQQAEWIILNGYPIDFDALKGFFNQTEWQYLSTIVREKHDLIST